MLKTQNLDDLNFNEILSESTELLQEIIPEWTNYNAADPGIAFLEMLTWLTEMQRYYLSKITKKHELKYLKLLGIRPASAEPSRITAVFEPVEAKLDKGAETEIAGVSVTLNEEVNLSSAVISLSRTFTEKTTEHYGFMPFGSSPQTGDEFYISLSKPLSKNVLYRLYICLLSHDGAIRNPMQEGYYSLASIRIEALCGDDRKICEVKDKTYGFTQNGVIEIISPSDCCLFRCSLTFAEYDIPPMFDWVSFQTAQFSQKKVIAQSRFFISGENMILLDTEPYLVIPESLDIVSEESGKTVTWELTDDLSCSSPHDRFFEFDTENNAVKFGDNIHGKSPEGTVIINRMELTLGENGNVKSNIEFDLNINGKMLKAYNPFPGKCGKSGETVAQAFERFKNAEECRAVSMNDYIRLIMSTPGLCIDSAAVYSSENGKLCICAKPHFGALSETYIRNIKHHIFERRLPCIEISVIPPIYLDAEFIGEILFEEWAGGNEKEVKRIMADYAEKAENQFGLTVSISEQKRILEAMPFVRKVNFLYIRLKNGDIIDTSRDYALPPNGLLRIHAQNIAIKIHGQL